MTAKHLLATLLLAACRRAQTTAPARPPPPPRLRGERPHGRLYRLFHDSDEANLRRNPISGMFRGDYRYAAHLGDYITDEYFAGERTAAESELATLHAIDRNTLDETDKLAYDVFEYQRQVDLDGLQPDMLALTAVRPLNHFSGFHTFYPSVAAGPRAGAVSHCRGL